MTALARVFLDKDCSLAEINPLVVTPKGEVLALDAKMTFDDNALFRHPDIEKLRDETEENPAELRAAKVGPELHQPDRQHRLPGQRCRPGHEHDGHHQVPRRRAGQLPRRRRRRQQGPGASRPFGSSCRDPKVKAVLVNIFGGIMKCDLIAEALVKAGREVGFKVPVVVRLEGTNVGKAREILGAARTSLPTMQTATDLTDAAKKVVAAAG